MLEYGKVAQHIVAGGVTDIKARLALERALFIVGEAAAGLHEPTKAAIDLPWPRIIALRNRLAHQYARIETERLVEEARTNLPTLLTAIESYLAHRP